jgi:transcriptional regulator with XRE-family HTH domain
MIKRKLTQKYTPEELAESVVFPVNLTSVQKKEAAKQLAAAREKSQKEMSDSDRLSLQVFQLRFQLEDYLQNKDFDPDLTFGYFLKQYVDLLKVKRKDFADDISIDETLLSQFINRHRLPPDYIAIRLEIHSNNSIPAIYWIKLVEKQKEYELNTDKGLRRKENKFVHRKLSVTPVRDYENDPFFVQKAESSRKVIEKYGIPKGLLTVKK